MTTDPTEDVEIICTLNTKVTAKQAHVIVSAIKDAMKMAYPGRKIRGLWVHKRTERV